MPVSEEMRLVEKEIDETIASLKIWKYARDKLLWGALNFYRNQIESLFRLRFLNQDSPKRANFLLKSLDSERQLRAGLLWFLIWTMEKSEGNTDGPTPALSKVANCVNLASKYEMLVDILKMAKYSVVTIKVDDRKKMLTVFEGGDFTGADSQMFYHQAFSLPYLHHEPLVEGADQLTSRWKASDFRTLVGQLSDLASGETSRVQKLKLKDQIVGYRLPAIVEIADVDDHAQQAVIEDLTMSPETVRGRKRQLGSWLDIPFVLIGAGRFGISDMVRTIGGEGRDEQMLRIANRVDPNQYSKVSQLREDRMAHVCDEELQKKQWSVTKHYQLLDHPPREIDVYACRGDTRLVVQLKSTLRPETPWEVYKRNDDILKGINHTACVMPRFPAPTYGFVITDGYRGDFVAWKSAIEKRVPIGILSDISEIAESPERGADMLKNRVGLRPTGSRRPIPNRQVEMLGWKINLVDAPAPSN